MRAEVIKMLVEEGRRHANKIVCLKCKKARECTQHCKLWWMEYDKVVG